MDADTASILLGLAGVALTNVLVWYRLGCLVTTVDDHKTRIGDLERIAYKVDE